MLLLLFVCLWGGVCCLYGQESLKRDCNSLSWDVLPEVLPFRIKKKTHCPAQKGKRGWKSSPCFFGGEKNRGVFGRGDRHRLPRTAAGCLPALALHPQPVCLSHGRRAAWCCESREKNRPEDGGPLGRKSGTWEQLGDAARARAGEAPAPGKGGSWGWRGEREPQPPGFVHSWRKWHFWGQSSAWEKFQGCLWSAAATEPPGPGATVVALRSRVSVGWLLLLGLGRHCSNLQMCQSLGWLLRTMRGDRAGPALVWSTKSAGAGCTLGEPSLGTSCLSFPIGRVASLEVLPGSAASGVCGQCPACALREAALPVPHVRPLTEGSRVTSAP